MNSLSSVAMTLASFSILLIVLNTGFSLQSVLGESIEDSVDRIIESAMDDDNDERDNDNDERDNDNDERDANDSLSEDFSGGLSDDFNYDSPRIFVNFDEDNDNLSVGSGNEGNHVYFAAIPNQAAIDRGSSPNQEPSDYYQLQRQIEDALFRD